MQLIYWQKRSQKSTSLTLQQFLEQNQNIFASNFLNSVTFQGQAKAFGLRRRLPLIFDKEKYINIFLENGQINMTYDRTCYSNVREGSRPGSQ